MALTAPPPAPLASDTPGVFDAKGYALMQWYATNVAELNAFQILNNSLVESGATAAAGSAAQASVFRDQALAAWAASMYPAETLPAISKSIHSGAVVKAIIYDTSKDSDGGAWRKRCADKSWYQEALGGTVWLGQAGTAAAAWALSGAATGAYFQNTTDGKYYQLGASSPTVAEVIRGNVREFPEQVAIIAETARIVIYDLTQVGCPMWMVFPMPSGAVVRWFGFCSALPQVTSAAAINGSVIIGNTDATNGSTGVSLISFIADGFRRWSYDVANTGIPKINIANRSATCAILAIAPQIVNRQVNDVAITVLQDAPIDPATGLPTPTIAVATVGGVSVIHNTGSVVSLSSSAASNYGNTRKVGFTRTNRLVFVASWAGTADDNYLHVIDLPTAANTASFGANLAGLNDSFSPVPALMAGLNPAAALGGVTIQDDRAKGTNLGLSLVKANAVVPAKGMVAYITNAYNSGWQVGDIRGAWLADTTVETITASGELVVNGTFATDASGWIAGGSGTLSLVSGALRVTNSAAATGYAYQSFATVIGRSYSFLVTRVGGTAPGGINLGVTPAGGEYVGNLTSTYGTFVATSTVSYITMHTYSTVASQYYDFDNISIKLSEADRSIKNSGLVVNGSLSKASAADGSGLVVYSGFSAANYLEQSYNSALDFGTGDFCAMGWVYTSNSGTVRAVMFRGLAGATFGLNAIHLVQSAADKFCIQTTDASETLINCVGASAVSAAGWHFVVGTRRNGTLEVWVDGVLDGTIASSHSLTNASSKLYVGGHYYGAVKAEFTPSVSLLRISATAPSADQIAHIYRTELPLFQPGAQCTLAGTSSSVTALAYDDTADLLQVGTSWGRSGFKDLLRVDSEATSIGSITSLSANQGAILTGGITRYYQPAMLLRDELRRQEDARKALSKIPVFIDFDTASFASPTTSGSAALTASSIVGTPYIGMGVTGTGIPAGTTLINIVGTAYTMSANATVTNAGSVAIAQSSFTLQQGYTTKAVYSAGALKRLGSTKDYLTASDGFRETVNFGTSPGSAVWVSVMAVRA